MSRALLPNLFLERSIPFKFYYKLNTKKIIYGCVFLLLIGLFVYFLPYSIGEIKVFFINTIEWVRELSAVSPVYLLLSIALLPIFCIPVSPFFMLAGVVYGVWPGILIVMMGLLLNSFIVYTLVSFGFRAPVRNFLQKRGYNMLDVPETSTFMVTAFVRAMPLFPFSIQNYLLSLAGVPFLPYFLFVIPVQLVWVSLFVGSGSVIFEREYGITLFVLLLFVSLIILSKILSKKYRNRVIS